MKIDFSKFDSLELDLNDDDNLIYGIFGHLPDNSIECICVHFDKELSINYARFLSKKYNLIIARWEYSIRDKNETQEEYNKRIHKGGGMQKFKGNERRRNLKILLVEITQDGDSICALYGENLQVGIAGFGNNIPEAIHALADKWEEVRGLNHGFKKNVSRL